MERGQFSTGVDNSHLLRPTGDTKHGSEVPPEGSVLLESSDRVCERVGSGCRTTAQTVRTLLEAGDCVCSPFKRKWGTHRDSNCPDGEQFAEVCPAAAPREPCTPA